MKDIKEYINEGISYETYSNDVDTVQEVLDQCIEESNNEKEGIESFINDILDNLEYDVIGAIKKQK